MTREAVVFGELGPDSRRCLCRAWLRLCPAGASHELMQRLIGGDELSDFPGFQFKVQSANPLRRLRRRRCGPYPIFVHIPVGRKVGEIHAEFEAQSRMPGCQQFVIDLPPRTLRGSHMTFRANLCTDGKIAQGVVSQYFTFLSGAQLPSRKRMLRDPVPCGTVTRFTVNAQGQCVGERASPGVSVGSRPGSVTTTAGVFDESGISSSVVRRIGLQLSDHVPRAG